MSGKRTTRQIPTRKAEAQLEAKIQRSQERTLLCVELWKDQLFNRMFAQADASAHADLIEAMLEIAIDWKIAHVGVDCAQVLLTLAFRRLAAASRSRLH